MIATTRTEPVVKDSLLKTKKHFDLKTKKHFEILDGLRGVAALAVLVFHFMEIAVPDYHVSFISHAYLAVDFFFCLSGFVIAYAYDNRLPKIGVSTFLKLRFIRLHPLVVIMSIIGLLAFMFDPFSSIGVQYSDKLLMIFLASCFMIPYASVPERYLNFFHLNPPTWSLFWEYVANIAYAAILARLNNRILSVLLLIAAGVAIYESAVSGFLNVGWGGENFHGGGVRVFYSFLAGMVVYRFGWMIKSPLGFGVLSIMLFAAFVVPFDESINWWADPLIVLVYFPFIVALGAGAHLNKAASKICRLSGELSYPLYMVHYPFIWWYMSWIETCKPPFSQIVTVMIAGVPLMVLLAYVVNRFLDIPLRRYLKKKMIRTA